MIWPTKKLGDVCEVVGGGTPKTERSEYWGGKIVWITPRDLGRFNGVEIFNSCKKISEKGLKESSAKLLPIGAVVFSSRAPIGYVAIAGVPLATNQGCRSFICNEKYIYNKYLFYFLLSKTDYLNKLGGGSTFKEISGSKLKEVEISLPSVGEQKKIVSKVEKLLAKIKEAKLLREEAIKAAQNLLPGELYKIFKERKTNNWTKKKIEAITDLVTKGTTPKTLGYQYTPMGIPFLRAENIDGMVDSNLVKLFISEETNNILSRSKTKSGDVLITIAGTIGRVGWLPKDSTEMNMNQAVALVRPKKEEVDTKYLAYALNGYSSQKQVSAGTVKGAIPNFSLTMIRNMTIPIPSITEQKNIVARLDSLSEKIQQIQERQRSTQSDLISLEQSLLNKAFSGELQI